jgi:hypothetical protein
MSLEGNLTAFGLSEILQLIAVQQKSGMLSVTRQSSSTNLFFRDGRIVSTRDRRRSARDPLKDYLARYGIIPREEIARLTEVSSQSKMDFTDVILSEGVFSEEALAAHCRTHIQETVHDILTWEQCSYRFIPGSVMTSGVKVLADVGVEGLLMESMRRIDEFPLLLKDFPDGEATVRTRPESGGEEGLTPAEKAFMEALSGGKTIDDLVAHAKMPRFETFEVLKQLKEKNLIDVEAREFPAQAPESAVPAVKRFRDRQRPNPLPLVAAAVVFVVCTLWGARSILHIPDRIAAGATVRSAAATIPSRERNQAEDELRWYLEVYRAELGSYPADLGRLNERGFIPEEVLERAKKHAFRYYLTPRGDRYILL